MLPVSLRVAERQRLVDGLAVDGQARRQPHALVVPWRLRVPLVGEVDPERRRDDGGLEGEPLRALQLLGELAADRVDDVDLAALQRRQPRRLVVDRLEHQALDARGLAPVLVERLERQLHARRERDELVGAGADRRLLVSLVADLLHVLLGHDPAGSGGAGVEREEVGPRRFELEADLVGVGRLDGGHPVLDLLVRTCRDSARRRTSRPRP